MAAFVMALGRIVSSLGDALVVSMAMTVRGVICSGRFKKM